MLIKPIGYVPAHRHDAIAAVAFHIVNRETNEFCRETAAPKGRLGVGVGERNLVAVDRVLENSNHVAGDTQDVTVRVWFVG